MFVIKIAVFFLNWKKKNSEKIKTDLGLLPIPHPLPPQPARVSISILVWLLFQCMLAWFCQYRTWLLNLTIHLKHDTITHGYAMQFSPGHLLKGCLLFS